MNPSLSFRKSSVLRYPSLRAPLDLLFLVCCIALTADVLGPEIWGNGKTKDYPLWFWAGQQVLQGRDLYPNDPSGYFNFIYPPLSAVLLALPSWFGKVALYSCLSLLNIVAWWMTGQFSNAMTGSGKMPTPFLFALPGIVTVTFVFDMFDLGQPNLVLLALMLYGFWLLQHQRPWMAGSMFALATAIKVFPVAVLPYLVWRRKWAAVASTVAFLGIFLFVVPAPIRGFQHNVSELKTWYRGMIGSSSEKGFGQRDEQNWSWVNQSIIAMTHRLTRPINYNQEDPAKPPRTMNLVTLDFKTAMVSTVGYGVNNYSNASTFSIGARYYKTVNITPGQRTQTSDLYVKTGASTCGGDSVSLISAARAPIPSTLKSSVPPSTSVKYFMSRATSSLGV